MLSLGEYYWLHVRVYVHVRALSCIYMQCVLNHIYMVHL